MPINWTSENVARLFLITLNVHNIHMDYKLIAAAFGEEASPRAIEEKMKKLRKEFREFSLDANGQIIGTKRGRGGRSSSVGTDSKTEKTAYSKGRARPVKYEDGQIKWEYDNREDDSEEDDEMTSRTYGDLMECYLLKKEAIAAQMHTEEVNGDEDEDDLPLYITRLRTHASTQQQQQQQYHQHHPHQQQQIQPYHIVNRPMFSPASFAHDGIIDRHGNGLQMHMVESAELGPVMDPTLMQEMGNITFHPMAADMMRMGFQYPMNGGEGMGMGMGMITWEQNQDLLNAEYRGVDGDAAAATHAHLVPQMGMNGMHHHMYMGPSSHGQLLQAPSYQGHHEMDFHPHEEINCGGHVDVQGIEPVGLAEST